MFSIKREEKITMNFEGSPQCGNAGDMRFKISIEGFGFELDSQGFVFDSVNLFSLFKELKKGKWQGSCEGIGVYCAEWLLTKEEGVTTVEVKVTTESTNVLSIALHRSNLGQFTNRAIQRVK